MRSMVLYWVSFYLVDFTHCAIRTFCCDIRFKSLTAIWCPESDKLGKLMHIVCVSLRCHEDELISLCIIDCSSFRVYSICILAFFLPSLTRCFVLTGGLIVAVLSECTHCLAQSDSTCLWLSISRLQISMHHPETNDNQLMSSFRLKCDFGPDNIPSHVEDV